MLSRLVTRFGHQVWSPDLALKVWPSKFSHQAIRLEHHFWPIQLAATVDFWSYINIFRGLLVHRVLQGRHILVYFSVSWLASLLFNRRHKITWRLKGERVVVVGDYQSQNSQRTKATRFLQVHRLTLKITIAYISTLRFLSWDQFFKYFEIQ